jgi:hypothetical protein
MELLMVEDGATFMRTLIASSTRDELLLFNVRQKTCIYAADLEDIPWHVLHHQ